MDEKTIKELLKRGYMVTPETLKRVEGVGVDEFFSDNRGAGTFLRGMKKPELRKAELKITIKKPEIKTNLSPADIVKSYNSRYNNLKTILLGKIDAMSINKAATQFEASVIGMVRQVSPQGFSVEDPTGSIEVISKERVDLDDVIGVRGVVREGVIQEKEIIYPDIPLNRQTPKIDATTQFSVNTENKITTITLDGKEPHKEHLNFQLWVVFEKGEDKIHMLVYKPPKEAGPNIATTLLKKRHLYPGIKQIASPKDSYVIDTVPEFFWIIGKERWKSIYKGVSVFSTKENDSLVINLSTRELIFP